MANPKRTQRHRSVVRGDTHWRYRQAREKALKVRSPLHSVVLVDPSGPNGKSHTQNAPTDRSEKPQERECGGSRRTSRPVISDPIHTGGNELPPVSSPLVANPPNRSDYRPTAQRNPKRENVVDRGELVDPLFQTPFTQEAMNCPPCHPLSWQIPSRSNHSDLRLTAQRKRMGPLGANNFIG